MLIYSCPTCHLQEESISYPSLCPYCNEIIETPQFAKTKNIPKLDSDKYYKVLGLPFNGKYVCIECKGECKVYNIELFY